MSEQIAKPQPGKVYTFYSYKGGVGRSMAVANIGVLLALAGNRVLLVDWDLEAPGLELFFNNTARLPADSAAVPGIVDLLESRVKRQDLAWQQCVQKAEFLGTSLDIITAGSRKGDYRQRIQQLDWEVLYRDHRIGNFINDLREDWRSPDHYDFVLVDSRTGITDIGDICTILLPDALVLMFVTNLQNVEGIKSVVARAVKARKSLPLNRSKLLCIPLPARDEVYNEYDKSLEWKTMFAKEFAELYRDWLPKEVTPADALNKLFIPYVTNWSFGERIPVLENSRETSDPTTIGAAYKRVANLLANSLDWYSLEGAVPLEDLQSARVALMQERERRKTLEADQSTRLQEERSRGTRRSLILAFVAILVTSLLTLAYEYWIRPGPDPAKELVALGWTIGPGDKSFSFKGNPPFVQSVPFLRQLHAQSISISDLTRIAEIDTLEELESLSKLQLGGDVIDLSPLSKVTQLTSLSLSGMAVSDLSPLAGLSHLKVLDASRTAITGLDTLADLHELLELDVSGTSVSWLGPLAKLTRLRQLKLSGTRVSDLNALQGMAALQNLDISHTDVSNLKRLAYLPLNRLDVSSTKISEEVSKSAPVIGMLREKNKNLTIVF